MKPRILAPYKILAVALSAAACTAPIRAVPETSHAEIAKAPAAAAPAEAATANETPSPAGPIVTAPSAPAPATGEGTPALHALPEELGDRKAKGKGWEAHFRPLCDKDGYPLVGNVMRKGPVGLQPSEFCASVREKRASR